MEVGAGYLSSDSLSPSRALIALISAGLPLTDSAKVWNRFTIPKQLLHAKNIRFATEGEVEEITKGVKPGGVPPFGNLFGLEVISDKTLYDNETIVFNAGRTSSIGMKAEDYKHLVQPRVEDIV